MRIHSLGFIEHATGLALLLAIVIASPASADLIVDAWTLGVGCNNAFGSPAVFHTQLQNSPFNPVPRSVSVHNSTATAGYSFGWGLAGGTFHIDADLASEGGVGLPSCATDNRVDFHITQDMLLTIDAEWSYQFTGGDRYSETRFWVRNLNTGNFVLIRGDVGDTVAGDPPSDTLQIADSILLAPGNYFVRTLMVLGAAGGGSSSVSTAHGFAGFTLTTVPEPVTAGGLAVVAVILLRRARGHCSC